MSDEATGRRALTAGVGRTADNVELLDLVPVSGVVTTFWPDAESYGFVHDQGAS